MAMVSVVLEGGEVVAHRLDRLVGTDPDAGAAVDAAVGQDGCLAAAHPNSLSGAVFDACSTAAAFFEIQDHGMAHG